MAGTLITCSPPIPTMAQLETTHKLTMATVNSATTYYLGPNGPEGFAYDLGRRFAQSLGLSLEVLVVPNRRAAIRAVRSGRAHFAAGLGITPARRKLLRFTPSYYSLRPQVVIHRGGEAPDDLKALDGELVVAGHTAVLAWLRSHHPDLAVRVEPSANAEELLYRVANGDIAATVASANVVSLNQRYYPGLRVAFHLPMKTELAWAFPRQRADRLFAKAAAFCAQLQNSGALRVITNRYFGHADRLGFVGGRFFAKAVKDRLDQWRGDFKQAAKAVGFDWRLLAAMGYQESHWDPDAVSPTGVQGLMMLTEAAASDVGVEDRTDPQQSIRGGRPISATCAGVCLLRSRNPTAPGWPLPPTTSAMVISWTLAVCSSPAGAIPTCG
ncbi:MAG: transporter substrate-binding domain-containing protein [Salinisphaera sp.]|nr:transporter substrate-binding domain-containing protein [Salinisphaera sp.]